MRIAIAVRVMVRVVVRVAMYEREGKIEGDKEDP